MENRAGAEMELPGFRFHPTEEELLDFYLKRVVQGKKLQFDIIPTVHLYRHDPWELPGLARIGEREWYFFVPRDRKQANGGRPSRTTERGFWKATGSDRPVRSVIDPKRLIGLKKTLVYYEGRAPRGTKTDWVMNEYRLPTESNSSSGLPPKEDIVLCKVYRKAVSLKELEQRVAMEETRCLHNSGSPVDSFSSSDHDPVQNWMFVEDAASALPEETKKKEIEEEIVKVEEETVALPPAKQLNLPELELPKFNALEWMQDPFLTQLRSPWMDQWSPYYTGVLNF
ncbi:NAC domain-containing protein 35 [Rhynchospora pubera]|uniref:NAC domain-containing protein 35 n=1 Tax=Rhynchospora pubera TaxID=906938 RepID=A0AAV8EAZ7_9POAL|nr:NAC domain-containing protein 35 [Rhynchospora pubera]